MSSRASELESSKASGDALEAEIVQELRALVESAEYAIESYADRMQHLMGLADHVAESPFQKWLAKNGADLEFDDQGEPRRMRIDMILSRLKADSFEDLTSRHSSIW